MSSLIYWLFLASGAAGLIYEVIWMRVLMRILGATVVAYTIVLSAFMLGLAIGGWRLGRRIDRRGNPLRVYAALEFGIAVWAVTFHLLAGPLLELFSAAARSFTGAPVLVGVTRCLLAFAALLVPTVLMGGTLPVLSKFVVQRSAELGQKVGQLYATNTAGAIVGTGLAGFILIGGIGEFRTTLVAAALNVTAAACALLLAFAAARRSPVSAADEEVPSPDVSMGRRDLLVLAASAVTGFTILAYEVLWTRTGVLLVGNTSYSFNLMLLCFLTGIALGSAAMAAWLHSARPSLAVRWQLLAGFEALIGIVALISFASPVPAVSVTSPLWKSIGGPLVAWFPGPALALLVLLAPLTLLSGASFPLAAGIYNRDLGKVGGGVGAVYLWNTIGAAAGSAAAGFLLLPRLGIAHSFLVCVGVNVLAGAGLVLVAPGRSLAGRLRAATAWCAGAAAVFAVATIATGGLQIPRILLAKHLDRPYRKCIFYKEDINGIVSVWFNPNEPDPWTNNKRLYIDAQPMAVAYRYGMIYERLQAHYPLLLHPDPKDVLVVCLGTGTTLGSVGQFAVSTIDCVELSRSVVAAGVRFRKENHDILSDPRVRVHIDDGRNYLLTTTKRYDVITAEPMHPHLAGTVNLYTKEYFQLVRSRLRPGGICSHWIPVHMMRPDEVKSAVQAFREVFPHAILFLETEDIIILGSDQPIGIDVDRWRKLLAEPRISFDLAEVGLSSVPQLLSTFMMGDRGIAAYAGSARAVTDDLPTLEFYGSLAPLEAGAPQNVRDLVQHRDPEAVLRDYLVGQLTLAEDEALGKLYPLESVYLLAYADLGVRDLMAARTGFAQVLALAPDDKRAAIHLNDIDRALGFSAPGASASPPL